MFNTQPIPPWQLWLFGHNRRQQIPIAMTLASLALYAMCLAVQGFWVWLGYAEPLPAAVLAASAICAQTLIYVALRSGWSQRFADPALTLLQVVLALLALAAGYLINPFGRGVVLMIGAVVLVFGAFTLSPRRCRQTGWLGLAVFGVAMAIGVLSQPEAFTPIVEAVHFVFTAGAFLLTGHLAGRLSGMRDDLRRQKAELRAALERVNVLATRDELTALPNRRCMLELIEREVPRLRRHGSPLCVAVLDLDLFKAVNDRFGHAVGDKVLATFAVEALQVLREADTLARWGGEEFLLMLPDTPPALAAMVIQRLHEHLRNPANWTRCREAQVTFSAGLALHDPDDAFELTLERADAALYEAKRSGRDRCVEAPARSAAPLVIADGAPTWRST